MDIYKKTWDLYERAWDTDEPCFEYLQKKNDECKVFKEKDGIYFVFRGSNDILDWVCNLNYSSDFEKAEFHEGFEKSSFRFFEDVEKIVNQYKENTNIFFVGHSRGGALAAILTVLMCENHPKHPFICVTFGQPRTFTKNALYRLSKLNNILLYRCFFKRDFVTKLPLKLQGFVHFSTIEKILPSKWWHYLPFISSKIKVHISYGELL